MSDDLAYPEGIGRLLHAMLAPTTQDGPPYVHTFQPPAAPEDQPALPWVDPPPESADWTWEQWQRFASTGFLQMAMHADDVSFFGPDAEPPSWDAAEAMYDRMQQVQAEETTKKQATANRRYWSGPDKFDHKILRAYRVKFRHLGLAPRSVLDERYRRRQINRRRRK